MARRWQPRIVPAQYAHLLFWTDANKPWFDSLPQFLQWYREWWRNEEMRQLVAQWRDDRELHEQERSRA